MELRVLGPVEVHAGGHMFAAGRPQQAVVLAALIADVGRPVPVDSLVDRVWGEMPPERARRLLQTHIARTRKVLEDARAHDGDRASVTRRGGSYVLDARPESVDLNRFRGLVAQAGTPNLPAAGRAVLLREALGLWRGEPMAGLSGQWVEQTRHLWRQQRLHALLEWAQAETWDGDPTAVIEQLTPELTEHPLAEPIAVALMHAFYAAGRSAEALDCYATVRRRLAEELGTDPGPQLRAAHQAILRGEAGRPATAAPVAPVPRAAMRPPALLPADVAGFTGRDAELGRLDLLLSGEQAVVISAVSGMAGVGKTALAVHWAHRARDRFPDGQLYLNLRGYDPDRPVTAAEALALFLEALGVAPSDLTSGVDERAARYRTEVAGRRLLIVLDNASTVEQLRPLLPGTGPCAVLVTSRDSLAGLVAVHGAHRIDLDVLPAIEAYTLLRKQIGARAEVEPEAVTALVERCARLPLALRVAAELALSRPETPLADLADELADEQRRLDLLDAGGDPRAAVTAAFSWSLQHLPPDARSMFVLLGLHPGPDIDSHAAAALAGAGVEPARHALSRLVRAHLIHHTGRDRVGMHDLLRAYAASLAAGEIPDEEGRASADRLFDHYLVVAAAATRLLYPNLYPDAPQPPDGPASPATVKLADVDAARRWLDTERSCLAAVAAHTAMHGRPAHTVRLSAILFRYLDGGHRTEALTIHTHAYHAAQQIADVAGQAHAARLLGDAHLMMRDPGPATEYHRRALALFRQTGDLAGQAAALNGLGRDEQVRGRYGQAIGYHRRAMALFGQAGDYTGQARTYNKLGAIAVRRGQFQSAATHFRHALAAFRRAADIDRTGEASALNNLGLALLRLDRYEEATTHLDQGLSLCRRLGNVHGEAAALDNLGAVHNRLGRTQLAIEYHSKAFALFATIGEHDGQAWALNGLGEAACAAGQPVRAAAQHRAALAVATETGATDQRARAHAGLGQALDALGEPVEARLHYEQALALDPGLKEPSGAV